MPPASGPVPALLSCWLLGLLAGVIGSAAAVSDGSDSDSAAETDNYPLIAALSIAACGVGAVVWIPFRRRRARTYTDPDSKKAAAGGDDDDGP